MKILRTAVAAVLLPLVVILAGCPSQTQTAALVQVLGNDSAALVLLISPTNTTLANQLTTDTAAAVTAVNNWKQGTPSQDALQALNLVVADINLISQIPGAQAYAPYILLVTGTAQSIIAILSPAPLGAASANVHYVIPTAKQFKQQCLSLSIPNPKAVCK